MTSEASVHDTPALSRTPTRAPLAIVAAVARNGVIGSMNRLPWRLPDDLARFRALTLGHTVVMGRRTWESIGKPLRDRENVVVTRRASVGSTQVKIAPSLVEAIAMATYPAPVCVIGGEALFREALPVARRLYITAIDREFEGDTYFPPFDAREWRECRREDHRLDGPEGFTYHFVDYERANVSPA